MVDIPVTEVDCTVETEICGRYGIRGYPGIKLVTKDLAYDYDGPREAKDIAEWSKKMRLPMFTPVMPSEISATGNYFIVYGPEDATAEMENLLVDFKGKVDMFYVISDEKKVVAVRQGTEIVAPTLSKSALKTFVEDNKVDFFPDLRQNGEYMVNRPGKQLVLVCLSKDEHSEWIKDLELLAKQNALSEESAAFLNKFTLAKAEAGDMAQFIEQFEKPVGEIPFIVFYQGKNEKSRKYAKVLLDEKEDIVEQLKKAIDDWNAGKLKKAYIVDEEEKKKQEAKKAEKEKAKKEEKQSGKMFDKQLLEELKKYIDEKVANLATKADLENAIKNM